MPQRVTRLSASAWPKVPNRPEISAAATMATPRHRPMKTTASRRRLRSGLALIRPHRPTVQIRHSQVLEMANSRLSPAALPPARLPNRLAKKPPASSAVQRSLEAARTEAITTAFTGHSGRASM